MTISPLTLCIALSLLSGSAAGPQADTYVFNGSFEQDADADGVPDGWATYGRADIEQQLSTIADSQRGPAKATDPACTIIGGVAAPPDSKWVNEFIDQGGLQWCDAMNLHLYPHRGAPDAYENAFRNCRERMKTKGPERPIWFTEIGCYGDDDPPFVPFTVGDSAMNSALRPNELRAAGDLVKFAAILCAAGVEKIFYHAGTSSALNENSAGNMFFEYGGAPRKQYAAQAALSRLLGPDVEFVRKWTELADVQAFEFRSRGRTAVVLWTRSAPSPAVKVPQGYHALDLMGNPLPDAEVTPQETPMYLVQE